MDAKKKTNWGQLSILLSISQKDEGNRGLAIIGIIMSVPALLISLWKLYNFINIMY